MICTDSACIFSLIIIATNFLFASFLLRCRKGILLGVFFVTAGSSLDPQTVVNEWPTLLAGIAAFIAIKFSVIFSAGEFALGLTRADAARVGLLLAGGGEFAFVIFKLAEGEIER